MTSIAHLAREARRRAVPGLLGGVSLLIVACQRGEYAGDADTGRAAPATHIDPAALPPQAPDSTLGVARDTSVGPAIAGDTLGRRSQEQSPPPPRRP